MELSRNLLERKEKSIFSIIYGVVALLLLLILWIANDTSLFRWIYVVVFAPTAILNLINGFGFHIESLFGKAFVEINDDLISLKLGIWEKEQTVFWKDIKIVEHKLNKLQIHTTDNKIQIIDLSKSNFTLKNEMKEVISSIANKKKITIVD